MLWGDVKARVYGDQPPQTMIELRRRIQAPFTAIRRTRVTRRAVQAMGGKARQCVANQGLQVEGRL